LNFIHIYLDMQKIPKPYNVLRILQYDHFESVHEL